MLQQTVPLVPALAATRIRFPISHYHFVAGDDVLNIDALTDDLAMMMRVLNTDAEKVVNESIKAEARKLGISPDDPLQPGGGNIHFVANVTTTFDQIVDFTGDLYA